MYLASVPRGDRRPASFPHLVFYRPYKYINPYPVHPSLLGFYCGMEGLSPYFINKESLYD